MNLPWFVRWGTDVALFFIPAYTFANFPTTVFVFSAEKRRVNRRKEFNHVQLRSDSQLSIEDVTALNAKLNLKQ